MDEKDHLGEKLKLKERAEEDRYFAERDRELIAKLKQAQAAKALGVTQPRVSDLMRGRIDLLSADTLIDLLARMGVGVRLIVKPSRLPVRVA